MLAITPAECDESQSKFDTLLLPYTPFAAKTDHGHVYTGILTDEDLLVENFPTCRSERTKRICSFCKLAQKNIKQRNS